MFDWSRSEIVKILDVPNQATIIDLIRFEWEQEEGTAKATVLGRDKDKTLRSFEVNFSWARGVILSSQESDHLGILKARKKFKPLLQPNVYEVLNSPIINNWADNEEIFELSKEHQRHFMICADEELLNVIDTDLPTISEVPYAH